MFQRNERRWSDKRTSVHRAHTGARFEGRSQHCAPAWRTFQLKRANKQQEWLELSTTPAAAVREKGSKEAPLKRKKRKRKKKEKSKREKHTRGRRERRNRSKKKNGARRPEQKEKTDE